MTGIHSGICISHDLIVFFLVVGYCEFQLILDQFGRLLRKELTDQTPVWEGPSIQQQSQFERDVNNAIPEGDDETMPSSDPYVQPQLVGQPWVPGLNQYTVAGGLFDPALPVQVIIVTVSDNNGEPLYAQQIGTIASWAQRVYGNGNGSVFPNPLI